MAASSTVVVIGPAVSCEWAIGTMCVRLTSPTVGLNPTTPLTEAGQVIEPSVSVPIAAGARPMATATALPDDDPHGVRPGSYGFRVCPPTALQPLIDRDERILAPSDRLALPQNTAPPSPRRRTS